MRFIIAATMFVAALSTPVAAQAPTPAEPGSELTVYLLTMGPGDQVWEKFGHNAIWIHDEANHTDSAYHWGLFDFADKDFVPRFIQGRMRYAMGAFGLDETLDAYRRTNRTVWMQKLNLTPAQRAKLSEFVKWNVQPENRYYRYDYFRDNCSTRVRDALDMALGGSIKRASQKIPTGTTYRFHTERLTQDDWPVFTGTMMGLAQPTDRPIDAWEEMFLPVKMMERFKSIQIPTATGNQPLVTDQAVAVQSSRAPEDETVKRGIAGYLLIALALIAIGVVAYVIGARRGRGSGVLALALVWSLVAGIAGCILAFLWAFTDHLYSYRNENLFQVNPISLVLAGALTVAIWKRRANRSAGVSVNTIRIAYIVAAVSLLGFAVQVLPAFYQVNADAIALALPVHIAVVVALVLLARRQSITRT